MGGGVRNKCCQVFWGIARSLMEVSFRREKRGDGPGALSPRPSQGEETEVDTA